MQVSRRQGLRWLGGGLVTAAMWAAAGCSGGGDSGTKTTATPARPDPKELLNTAADNLEKANSFHFVVDHEKGTTPIVLSMQMNRAEGDVVRPDKLRADLTASLAGNKLSLKVVSIGETTKITSPLNPSRYQELPGGTKASDIFDPSAGASAAMRNAKNPQISGEDTVEGKKVWKIDGTIDAQFLKQMTGLAEAGFEVKGSAWIGQDTREVYKIRLDGPLGKDDTKEVVRVMTLSRYNDRIEITPVP